MLPRVLVLIKSSIKESSIDNEDDKDGDGVFAASARVPVAYAIVSAYQFSWFVTQVLCFALISTMLIIVKKKKKKN